MDNEATPLKKLIRASNLEDIVLTLAGLQPLVLHSTWLNNSWGSTINYSTYSAEWVCQFCHYKQYAESDAYGNIRSHQGDFEHGPDCLWKRAKEATNADA